MKTSLAVAVLFVSAFASAQSFEQSLTWDAIRGQATQIGRYDVDCATLSLDADDGDLTPYVYLRSTQWIEECRWVPTPGDPRRGGGGGGYRDCYTRPGGTWSENVRVRIEGRKPLLPWERDTFRVCLQGPWLDSRVMSAAYKYKQTGNGRGEIVYAPGEKVAMKPDAAGIQIAGLTPALVITLNDRWASYYAGERTKLKFSVKESRSGFDGNVGDLEVETAGGQPQLSFNLAAPIAAKLKAGKKYYVKVSFQRLGTISKNDSVFAGESSKVVYAPAPALQARN